MSWCAVDNERLITYTQGTILFYFARVGGIGMVLFFIEGLTSVCFDRNSHRHDPSHSYNSASDFNVAPPRVRILVKDSEKTTGETLVAKFKRVKQGNHAKNDEKNTEKSR